MPCSAGVALCGAGKRRQRALQPDQKCPGPSGAVSEVARARPLCVSPRVGGQEEAAAVDSGCCAVALLWSAVESHSWGVGRTIVVSTPPGKPDAAIVVSGSSRVPTRWLGGAGQGTAAGVGRGGRRPRRGTPGCCGPGSLERLCGGRPAAAEGVVGSCLAAVAGGRWPVPDAAIVVSGSGRVPTRWLGGAGRGAAAGVGQGGRWPR